MRNKFYARAWSILRPLVLFFRPVELRGTENLEDEAAILCANHSSAWDPILLVLAMPQSFNVRIMAKKQLFSIPVVGWFLRAGVKMVPVFIGMKKRLFRKTVITFGKPFAPTYTGRKGTVEEYQANTDEVMRRAYELGGVTCV